MIELLKNYLNNKIVILVILIVIFSIPIFITNNYSLNVLIFVGINAIVVIGLGLLLGYAGQISLGHAAFYGLGAYTSGYLTTQYEWPVWLAIIAGMIITGILAYIIGLPTLRLKGHYLAMATLGFGEIMSVFFVEMEGFTGGTSGMTSIPSPEIFGFTFSTYKSYYYLVWSIVVLITFMSFNLIKSRLGRALKSIHGSEYAAEASGVNTFKYKLQIFVLSAVYAALAGSLYAHQVSFISPTNFSFLLSIIWVIMVIVGSMNSLWGALLGAVFLTALPEYMRAFKEYNLLIFSTLLILTMLFMPKGIFSGIEKITNDIKNSFKKLAGS